MSSKRNIKFGMKVDRHFGDEPGFWSFGACLSHAFEETYLYVNFGPWCIAIGFMEQEANDGKQ